MTKKARRPTIDVRMAALRRAGTDRAAVAAALDEEGDLVAIAAQHVALHGHDLVPALVATFARLTDPKSDPGCRGKIAIAKALDELVQWEPAVFEVGARLVQLEGPTYLDDTAAPLRGLCALAHARFARPDTLDVCAQLLAELHPAPRVGAADAIAASGLPGGSSLLRYHVLRGERDSEVLAVVLDALLSVGRDDDRTAAWVMGLLELDERQRKDTALVVRAHMAAVALGGARITEAFPALRAWAEALDPFERADHGYLPLALLRTQQAIDHLLEVVARAPNTDAIAAAEALATFKDDPAIAAALRTAAESRGGGLRATLLDLLQ